MSFIEIQALKKNFGQTQVLRGVNLTLEEQSQTVLQGSSGSGKSTLLYIIGGLDHADSGVIKIAGQNLAQFSEEQLAQYRNQFIGFVFQFHYLLPSMDSLSNIMLPSRIYGNKDPAVEKRVRELAHHLGVTSCLNKYSFELSPPKINISSPDAMCEEKIATKAKINFNLFMFYLPCVTSFVIKTILINGNMASIRKVNNNIVTIMLAV